MTYEKLIAEVNRDWDNRRPKNSVPMKRCPDGAVHWDWENDCREINLWSCWQGGNDLHQADIMLVGQDWGNPNGKGCDILRDNIVNDKNYFENFKPTFPTDRNLKILFAELKRGGKQLYDDIIANKYSDLFFTNFCLGYRLGSETGGMTTEQMMLDSDYFRALVGIVQPKIIIALGKDTFECVVRTLKDDSFRISSNEFWDALNNCKSYEKVTYDDKNAVVLGMAHCGAFGVNVNRKKMAKAGNTLSGLELMKNDWRGINKFVDSML